MWGEEDPLSTPLGPSASSVPWTTEPAPSASLRRPQGLHGPGGGSKALARSQEVTEAGVPGDRPLVRQEAGSRGRCPTGFRPCLCGVGLRLCRAAPRTGGSSPRASRSPPCPRPLLKTRFSGRCPESWTPYAPGPPHGPRRPPRLSETRPHSPGSPCPGTCPCPVPWFLWAGTGQQRESAALMTHGQTAASPGSRVDPHRVGGAELRPGASGRGCSPCGTHTERQGGAGGL